MNLPSSTIIGVIGAGTMGRGIAQVAATYGHSVFLFDSNLSALATSKKLLEELFETLISKGKLQADEGIKILGRIRYVQTISELSACGFIIEAIVEDLSVKKELFCSLEKITSSTSILATNTSSLSITAIAANCERKERVIGVHFFNPAPRMALVEIVPSLITAPDVTDKVRALIDSWGKKTVIAKDTPGFIVNRIARPFYGEAIRIFEEQIAPVEGIDAAMKELGSFRMGPFELMDLIGNDINLKVSQSVFESFFYDSRYRPSLTQQRMTEAGLLGRKSGRGFYSYDKTPSAPAKTSDTSKLLKEKIFLRILAMLINEAVDALYLGIASKEDIDTAMMTGVNYPKGLLTWCDELGAETILSTLDALFDSYREERYRASVLLREKVRLQTKFY